MEDIGVQQSSMMRGQPAPLSWWQRRRIPQARDVPQPLPTLYRAPNYSAGADAFAPQFGRLLANVIGAGVPTPFKLPVIAGSGARYEAGAIFFDVQAVPTSVRISPAMSQESLAALLATAHVGPSYATTG
jgi:hypothetical protein